jgi:hypothetical protein
LIKGEEYQEEPFFASIDLKAANENKQTLVKPLVVLPNQRDIQMSLSPDGLALLFDQLGTRPPAATDNLRTNEGKRSLVVCFGCYPWLRQLLQTLQLKCNPNSYYQVSIRVASLRIK